MSRRGGGASTQGNRREAILVFGEDDNDRRALVRLVKGLLPGRTVAVEPIRHPIVLQKGVLPEKAAENAAEIAAQVEAVAAGRSVLAVVAHEDCDAIDPAHVAVAKKIEDALRKAGCTGVPIAAAPAWEIEAWWMVFPEAVASIVTAWRRPDDWVGKDVGKVQDAKEALRRAVRPRPPPKKPPRDYEEHDSIAIADAIVEKGLLGSFQVDHRATAGKGAAKVRTRCASFGEFSRKIRSL